MLTSFLLVAACDQPPTERTAETAVVTTGFITGYPVVPTDPAVEWTWGPLPEALPIDSVSVWGGTMESAPAIGGLVVADPEGNRLFRIVRKDADAIDLGPNARPFRLLVEGTQAWVTLRGTGELVAIDLDTESVSWRVPVCAEPRGVARSQQGPLVVACAEGVVVEVDDDGRVLRTVFVALDLRDILPVAEFLYVTQYRSGDLIGLTPDTLDIVFEKNLFVDNARVAWRMRPNPDRGAYVLLQGVNDDPISLDPDGGELEATYGGAANSWQCSRLDQPILVRVGDDLLPSGVEPLARASHGLNQVMLATDFVIGPEDTVTFANTGVTDGEDEIVSFDLDALYDFDVEPCAIGTTTHVEIEGRPSAIAFVGADLVLQTAAPLSVALASDDVVFRGPPPDDTSMPIRLFHQATEVGIACASCHPEGLDDANVWRFMLPTGGLVERRTLTLAGEILSRGPYHWTADLPDPDALMDDTFTHRMGGGEVDAESTASLFAWLDGLRPVRGNAFASSEAVALGEAVFLAKGCPSCHVGPAFADNVVHPLSPEGGAVKTPTLLGVGTREKLTHSGCADTVEDRFNIVCGDTDGTHGGTGDLTGTELNALITYLRTL